MLFVSYMRKVAKAKLNVSVALFLERGGWTFY